jgi:tRNA-dihydrouridine synthase
MAPMMGHTHRHFRNFFGQISHRAWLYTEMIPASRVVQSFAMATGVKDQPWGTTLLDPEWVFEHASRMRMVHHERDSSTICDPVLDELLNPGPNPSVLQLGGRDPIQLANAAAIGAAFGFQSINLNCGCPSTSVTARATGAAMMREPELVVSCLEAMSNQMDRVNPRTILSVKHRLGVQDAATYNAEWDHAQDDQEAYQSCRSFVHAISMASKVSRIQVHARIALLGLTTADTSGPVGDEPLDQDPTGTLWVSSSPSDTSPIVHEPFSEQKGKVNHKRVQYQAKRRARQVTLQNRSVPPLRPLVVDQIAHEFCQLEVSSNGGIDCIDEIQNRVMTSKSAVIGAMVGRAAINHPCSFGAVDEQVWGQEASFRTRRTVLSSYIEYCQHQEMRLQEVLVVQGAGLSTGNVAGRDEDSIGWHRRRLVSPVFHLFVGEDGNEAYQRRLRKLVERADRHSAHSMVAAAMAEIPTEVLDKPLHDHTPWKKIPAYDFVKRSGAMQRTIY